MVFLQFHLFPNISGRLSVYCTYFFRCVNHKLVGRILIENCLVSELCSSESLPEVEIISLLEEQIPRYKLRADTLTKFGGKFSFFKFWYVIVWKAVIF